MSDAGQKRGGDDHGGRGGNKHKRAKYMGQGKGGTGQALPHGSRGVLVTCEGGWEDRASQEALALIEDHYERVLASSGAKAPSTSAPAAPSGGSKDISALLAAEVAELKDKKAHRFQVHHTGVKGCVYIVMPQEPASPSPQEVVISICQATKDTKTLRGRHLSRLLPITHVGFASMDDIKALAPKVVQDGGNFPEPGDGVVGVDFAVEYEHRAADKFDRMEVINSFADLVPKPPHKVNLSSAQLTILVQLSRNVCACSVTPMYRELAKFNLKKLAEVEDEAEAKDKASKGGNDNSNKAKALAKQQQGQQPGEQGQGEAAVTTAEGKTDE